jgi:hypothetical protein
MTAKELIEQLQTFPPNTPVLVWAGDYLVDATGAAVEEPVDVVNYFKNEWEPKYKTYKKGVVITS